MNQSSAGPECVTHRQMLIVCLPLQCRSRHTHAHAAHSISFSFGVALTAALAKKYYQVLQRYYVQYMSGYDADVLNQLIQVNICLFAWFMICLSI